ncbi:serine hydrolase, partial [Nonomuraea rhizosphaerae]|uniref:serine hydrolase n=1 Tax=Nonomuraea rhizosphaerae TaxID=2665663 RepID=UPI001C5D844B
AGAGRGGAAPQAAARTSGGPTPAPGGDVAAPGVVARSQVDTRALDQALGRYLRGRPGRAAVAVHDRTTGLRYAFREREPFLLASVAKVDILLALLLRAQREHHRLAPYHRDLAARMIRHSDNQCAHRLYTAIGGQSGLTRTLRRLGIRHTRPGSGLYWGSTRSRPSDQVKVLDALADPAGPVSAANRRYALTLMSSVTRSQTWGVGTLDRKAALKNGWLPARVHGGLWTVNSIGRLAVQGHELLVAVLSERSPAMSTGVTTVERVARLAVKHLTG